MSDSDRLDFNSELSETMSLPPASFEFLVLSLRTQIEVQLGLLYFGSKEEKPEPDLEMARHGIDLLAVLQQKTRGNLSLDEQRLLDNSVTELRFRFVQASEERSKRAAEAPAASSAAEAAPAEEGQAS